MLEILRNFLMDFRHDRSERLDHAESDVTLASRLPSCDRRNLDRPHAITLDPGAQRRSKLERSTAPCGHGPTDLARTCQFAGVKAPSAPGFPSLGSRVRISSAAFAAQGRLAPSPVRLRQASSGSRRRRGSGGRPRQMSCLATLGERSAGRVGGEQREGLSASARRWRDEPGESKLVCGCPDGLAGGVVAYVREELLASQRDGRTGGACAEVEDVGDIDPAGHDASLQHARRECDGVVELVVDEVAVRLDHDARAGAPEVERTS
jgi:hypothetical protein